MKRFSITILCATILASTAQAQTSREALAAELYETMEANAPANATSQIIKQTLGAFESQPCFNEMQPRLTEMVNKYAKNDFSKNLAVTGYSKAFSAAELQEMIAFAKTPLGRKWFREQPRIAADAANAAMTHFQQNQLQIAQETMQLMEEFRGKSCE